MPLLPLFLDILPPLRSPFPPLVPVGIVCTIGSVRIGIVGTAGRVGKVDLVGTVDWIGTSGRVGGIGTLDRALKM